MKKYVVVIIVVLAFLATTMPACADSAFNDMSKCIQGWGKGGTACGGSQAKAAVPSKKCCCMKTDVLGNKVPCCTNNSRKVNPGK